MKRIPFVCGNWKMHHGVAHTQKQVELLVASLPRLKGKVQIAIAPVATTLFAAAEAQQRSVSEFVLQSALERADEALADRRLFSIPAEKWGAFMDALDAPPRDVPRLRKLLSQKTPFEA